MVVTLIITVGINFVFDVEVQIHHNFPSKLIGFSGNIRNSNIVNIM